MECCKNFDIHCTYGEAINLAGHLPVSVMTMAYDCYCDAYKSCKGNNEKWKIHNALDAVYMLGFLSGARAVRGARDK